MMKRLLVLLCFLGICQTAFTQVKPIYFIGDVMMKDSTMATSYAFFGKLSNEELWTIKRFDLYNDLLMTGSYKDNEMKIPHGKFTYYGDVDLFNNLHHTYFKSKNKYRYLSTMGNYIEGQKNGVWLAFYPDGKVLNSVVYLDNVLNGTYTSYDKKGKIISTGNYVNGIKDGEWLLHDGLQKDIYQLGVLKSSVKDEKLLKKEYYISVD